MIYAIGVPVVDHVPAEAYETHLALAAKASLLASADRSQDQVYIICAKNLLPHARAREDILRLCIEKNVDRLLFLDADMVVPVDGLVRLSKAMDQTKAAIVTGCFYQRGAPFACTWSVIREGKPCFTEFTPNSGLHDLYATGLAFTLIDVQWVAKNLRPPFFIIQCDGEKTLWEDGYFCTRVKAAGGVIMGDTGVQTGHLGFRSIIHCNNVTQLRVDSMVQTEYPFIGTSNGTRNESKLQQPEEDNALDRKGVGNESPGIANGANDKEPPAVLQLSRSTDEQQLGV